MKTFVIGDIHGGFRALKQCLERSKFNYKKDWLISLGDLTDGWPDTPFVFEELLKIKHLVVVEGNHDTWARQWFKFGLEPEIWTSQGGQATIDSYAQQPELRIKHSSFLDKTVRYLTDDKNRLYVHGGFKPGIDINSQSFETLTWDRDLYYLRNTEIDISPFSEVFIGHTSTWNISHNPFQKNNVWFLDQGAGWEGKLTIMDVDTREFWQSDPVKDLYYKVKGR